VGRHGASLCRLSQTGWRTRPLTPAVQRSFSAVWTAGRIPVGIALGCSSSTRAAFALQPVVGLLVDFRGLAKAAAVAGALLTAVSLPLSVFAGAIVPAVVTAGVGNAVFHAGGGATSLRMTPGRASAPGLFVAPGAAGVAAGVLLGKAGGPLWIPALLLVACAVAIALVGDGSPAAPEPSARATSLAPSQQHSRVSAVAPAIEGAMLLVLAVVALRSYRRPGDRAAVEVFAATVGRANGRRGSRQGGRGSAGGPLRAGACRRGCAGLLGAAADAGTQLPVAGILGMFAFNMTMPVTLVAVADVIPESPGFAFGLASLALAVAHSRYLPGRRRCWARLERSAPLSRCRLLRWQRPVHGSPEYAFASVPVRTSPGGRRMKANRACSLAVPILIFAAAQTAYADVVSGPSLLAVSAGLLIGAALVVLAVVALAWFRAAPHRQASQGQGSGVGRTDGRRRGERWERRVDVARSAPRLRLPSGPRSAGYALHSRT